MHKIKGDDMANENRKIKFIPYVCCGDPSIGFTEKLILALAPHSYAIELGIPFSDPIADGKTIQFAGFRALKNGVKKEKIFEMVARIKPKIKCKLIFMTYYNIVYSYGVENFLKKMNEIGVEGLIVPDVPFNEDRELTESAKKHNISIISLVSQNTPDARVARILEGTQMYAYLVAYYGITGERRNVDEKSVEFVRRMRSLSKEYGNRELIVGFGISNGEQVERYAEAGADGVIVGSALINVYSKYIEEKDGKFAFAKDSEEKALEEVEKFAEELLK